MAEKIGALVRLRFTTAADERVEEIVDAALAATRAFDGLEHLRVLKSVDDPAEWTLYEIWRDAEAEQAYRAFRATPEGADAGLASVVQSISVEHFTFHG